jgi:hypothetical protein
MRDLKNPRLMYLKAVLFVFIGLLSAAILLLDHPSWKAAGLLVLTVWAFARAYYFVFYVVEHYIDPSYRFAGITSFVRYLLGRPKT